MSKKLCTFSGCNKVVDHANDNTSPRCEKHRVAQFVKGRSKYTHHIDEKGKNIYHTPRWRRIRKAHLLMNPFCVECLNFNNTTLANTVDHIIEIKDGCDPYDMNNLQSLCPRHHNVKTGKEKSKRNRKDKPLTLSDFK